METIENLGNEILSGYLDHAHAVAHDLEDSNFWAYQVLCAFAEQKPEIAWQFIIEITQEVSDDETLEYIAASLLEDLVRNHPYLLIERIEILMQQDARFRKAISSVWLNQTPEDILARIKAAGYIQN